MRSLILVVPGFDSSDIGDLPGTKVVKDTHDDIYMSGVINDIIKSEYSVGLHNTPDIYKIDGAEWITTCSCSNIPVIEGDTFVNITSKSSALLSHSLKRMDEYKEDLIENVSSGKVDVCISSTTAVYDLCISCWAFPEMVSEMKSFALEVMDECMKKLSPTLTMMISYNGVRGFTGSDKNIRQYNGKSFQLCEHSGRRYMVSGKATHEGYFATDMPFEPDRPINQDDIDDIILASLGIGDPVLGVKDMTDYDTVIARHLESFGYV